jgi:ribosomal protein S18 acetylase RimI-like enzyme
MLVLSFFAGYNFKVEFHPMKDHEQNPVASKPGVVSLRPEQPDDEAFLFAVYASTRAEELAITGWDEANRSAFLNMQFRAMRLGYRSSFPKAEFSVVTLAGCPVGRLVVDRNADEIHVVDVALLPESRNHGLGTTILGNLLSEAQNNGKPVHLRVQKGSPANRLYQRLGFRQIEDYDLDLLLEWMPGGLRKSSTQSDHGSNR